MITPISGGRVARGNLTPWRPVLSQVEYFCRQLWIIADWAHQSENQIRLHACGVRPGHRDEEMRMRRTGTRAMAVALANTLRSGTSIDLGSPPLNDVGQISALEAEWLPDEAGVFVYKKNLAGITPWNPFSGTLNPEVWYYTKPAS
jgi:hypothetical protein